MENLKKILLFIAMIAAMPAVGNICVSQVTVQDYLDMASLYADSGQYYKALEYLNMIEKFDNYNPEIKYQKATLLDNLQHYKSAKFTLNQAIQLNEDYACSDLAISIFSNENVCLNKQQKH